MNKTAAPPPDLSPEELRASAEAAEWIGRLNLGPLPAGEAEAFRDWLGAHPENERQMRLGQAAMRDVLLLRGAGDLADLMRPSPAERLGGLLFGAGTRLRRLAGAVWSPPGAGALVSIAAAAAILVFLALPADNEIVSEQFVEAAAPAHATGTAEIRDLALPDGSRVTLGAASALDVRFTHAERRVVLVQGEAFFEVEPDPSRPFLVEADNTLVRVVGTKFDINLGAHAVDVAVLEGKVEVIRQDAPGPVIRDSDIKHILTAGQRVGAAKTGPVRPVESVDVESVAAWRRGQLIWIERPVAEIIADLNRYSEAPIRLADPSLGALEYNFALQAGDVPAGLALLAASLELEVHHAPDGAITLR